MSILDHNHQYEEMANKSDNNDGKFFWFCGSLRLNKKTREPIIIAEQVEQIEAAPTLHSAPPSSLVDEDHAGTYFKLNGSIADSDLSNSEEEFPQDGVSPGVLHQNGVDRINPNEYGFYKENGNDDTSIGQEDENDEEGMWFGLSGRQRRAESMQNLLDIQAMNGKRSKAMKLQPTINENNPKTKDSHPKTNDIKKTKKQQKNSENKIIGEQPKNKYFQPNGNSKLQRTTNLPSERIENKPKETEVNLSSELEDIDAKFKAIEQFVMESFDEIDFDRYANSKPRKPKTTDTSPRKPKTKETSPRKPSVDSGSSAESTDDYPARPPPPKITNYYNRSSTPQQKYEPAKKIETPDDGNNTKDKIDSPHHSSRTVKVNGNQDQNSSTYTVTQPQNSEADVVIQIRPVGGGNDIPRFLTSELSDDVFLDEDANKNKSQVKQQPSQTPEKSQRSPAKRPSSSNSEPVLEETIEQSVVKDDFSFNELDIDFINTYLNQTDQRPASPDSIISEPTHVFKHQQLEELEPQNQRKSHQVNQLDAEKQNEGTVDEKQQSRREQQHQKRQQHRAQQEQQENRKKKEEKQQSEQRKHKRDQNQQKEKEEEKKNKEQPHHQQQKQQYSDRQELPRALLKRQMNANSMDQSTKSCVTDDESEHGNNDYTTSEDEDNRQFSRGTSFRRSIVIEDEVDDNKKRRQSLGTCVSVAFMAVNTNDEDKNKKSVNQKLKGVLNFLENMVIDDESFALYYDAVRTLHTVFWDLKDGSKEQVDYVSPGESLSSVLNFLVVQEWPKVMLSCFKKLKEAYPTVFVEEEEAESTIYYSGHLPSYLRMNRTTSEFAIAVIFDGLLKAAINYTDVHEPSRQACCEDGLLSYLLSDIMPQLQIIKWGKATAREMFLKSICELVYNCAQSYSNTSHLLQHNCVDIFSRMQQETFHVVDARKVNMSLLLTLSFLIDDNNYDVIVPEEGCVIRVLQFLDKSLEHSEHTYHDFYAAELVGCLSRLAGHSEIKVMITRNSGQEILHKLLKYAYDDEERVAACHALWNLSFCSEAKEILRGMTKLMNHLRELSSSSNNTLRLAASGIIWECEDKYDIQGLREASPPSSISAPPHIMISYEKEAQPLTIRIRDDLNRCGFNVFMNHEQEHSLNHIMTVGVERASVVIVAVTRKYKLTPFTFAEVDYAHALRKPIIPVIIDVDFVPDGWLKDVIQSQKTFDFSRRSMFSGSLDALLEHLRNLTSPNASSGPQLNVESPSKAKGDDVLSWTNSDVIYWLKENQLIRSVSNAGRLNKLTGLHLLMFFDLKRESPDYYYSVLDSHLGFKDVLDTLEFTYAMDRLLGRERLI